MSVLDEITSEGIIGPQKIVIHGPSGVGKTTWSSKLKDAVIVQVEGGANFLNVAKTRVLRSWNELGMTVKDFADRYMEKFSQFKTVVIDSIDWAEAMLQQVLDDTGVDQSWGKGMIELDEGIRRLLRACDRIIDLGVNVVLTAHSGLTRIKSPSGTEFDRYDLKLSKKARETVTEWADNVFFAERETRVVNVDDKGKGVGKETGERILHTVGTAAYSAKNRIPGIPESLKLEDTDTINKFLEGKAV